MCVSAGVALCSVGWAELVHQPFGVVRLLDDSFLVVLPNGAAQFIVVHGRPVLPLTPKSSNSDGILDLEDAF